MHVGDGSAALDNYRIVRAFMERYPQVRATRRVGWFANTLPSSSMEEVVFPFLRQTEWSECVRTAVKRPTPSVV